jgi:predicted transcriptional regulator
MIMYSIRTIEKDGIITPSYLAEILTVMVNEVIGTLVSIMDEMATAVRNLKKI